MNDTEFKSILNQEITNSLGYMGGELSEERKTALEYYHGEPFGDEVEGRSQYISHDVSNTIEWMLPSLLKIFTSSDKAAEFTPEGMEDEEAAKQETDTINYVFYKENNGFLILYNWFKDALLQKNGIVKTYWDETKSVSREEYEGISEDELIMLAEEDGVEIIEHTPRIEEVDVQGQTAEIEVFDVAIKRTMAGTVIENVPPEEFLISRRHNSIDVKTAPFVGHRRRRFVSDLIEDGFDKDLVKQLGEDDYSFNEEHLARHDHDEEYPHRSDTHDESMREVWVTECYIRSDYDGDGIAELRKVTVGGNANVILDNEPIDEIPFRAITPTIMPHKFTGVSLADQSMESQRVKSVVIRQLLDNMYHQNNVRTAVVEGQVNLDDLLTSRPGGIVRMKQPNMALPLPVQPFTGSAFGMVQQLDSMLENRTGITKYNQGLDANTLNKTAHGIDQIMGASQERIKLIARNFAETGIKGLFLDIHKLELTHNTKKKAIKLRNKWVEVSPTEWKHRTNMTINVGLGTGEKDKQTQQAMMMLTLQEKFVAAGKGYLVPDEKLYSSVSKLVDTTDLGSVESFFANPKEVQKPQQPPSPEMMLVQQQEKEAQMKLQADQQKAQMSAQSDQAKMQLELEKIGIEKMKLDLERMKLESGLETKEAELIVKRDTAQMQSDSNELKVRAEIGIEERKLALSERELEINAAIKEKEMIISANQPQEEPVDQTPVINVNADVHVDKGGNKTITIEKHGDTMTGKVEEE